MAVTVNYLTVGSGATPPTAAQSFYVNSVTATLSPSSTADASAIVTHALAIPDADITAGRPEVVMTPLNNLANLSNWSVASQNANWTVFAKNNQSQGNDTVAQLQVLIKRPNTLER